MIRNLPALYDSKPNDPSARRIGSYVMWVAMRGDLRDELDVPHRRSRRTCSRSSWSRRPRRSTSTWTQWFLAFAPVGILLLLLVPLIAYWLYPPEVKEGEEVPKWAGRNSPSWVA